LYVHLRDPKAISWKDMMDELGLTEVEKAESEVRARRLVAESRAHRLAEVRRRQQATQVEVAKAMGVTQARVSRIEKGDLARTEVETLAAYVRALGGKLTIVADFGEEQFLLG
jgi:DNA-binding XRE family transcriptional regulator